MKTARVFLVLMIITSALGKKCLDGADFFMAAVARAVRHSIPVPAEAEVHADPRRGTREAAVARAVRHSIPVLTEAEVHADPRRGTRELTKTCMEKLDAADWGW